MPANTTWSGAIQQILVGYLFYIQQYVSVKPKLLIYPSLLTPTFLKKVTNFSENKKDLVDISRNSLHIHINLSELPLIFSHFPFLYVDFSRMGFPWWLRW